MVRAPEWQCQSRNRPGFDTGAADKAMLNKVNERKKIASVYSKYNITKNKQEIKTGSIGYRYIPVPGTNNMIRCKQEYASIAPN